MEGQEGFDVIVVGQGVMGSAALWQCAQRGASCLGVEQFNNLHSRGSSHGATRIIRSLYTEVHYAKLVQKAYRLWNELEQQTNTQLIVQSGAVDIAETNSSAHKKLLNTCEECKIPFKQYTSQQAAKRFPGLSPPENFSVIHSEKAGVIKATKSVQTMQSEASKVGAKLIDEYRLKSVESSKGSVKICLENLRLGSSQPQYTHLTCKKLIITPGAWVSPMMKQLFNINVHSRVLQMGYYYFPTLHSDVNLYHVSRFPVFIDYTPNEDGCHIYGTPAYEFPGLIKVGSHGPFPSCITSADSRTYEPLPELLSFAQQRVRSIFSNVDWNSVAHAESCLYTWMRDAEFLIDTVPENPDIVIGAGGSGHAFKHGSAIGSILADLALNRSAGEWAIPNFQFDHHLERNAKL